MAKKESTFFNMVLTLFLVSLVASTALGYIYELTKEPIEKSKLEKKLAAIKQVVPDFTNNPSEEKFSVTLDDGTELDVYPAKKDGNLVGMAIQSFSTKGFSPDKIKVMVGFKTDGTIHNISVIGHKETPGLGTKMESPQFQEQFFGKNPSDFKLQVKNDGGDVDAITAATISSRAFCDAVRKAYKAFKKGGKK